MSANPRASTANFSSKPFGPPPLAAKDRVSEREKVCASECVCVCVRERERGRRELEVDDAGVGIVVYRYYFTDTTVLERSPYYASVSDHTCDAGFLPFWGFSRGEAGEAFVR